MRSLWLGRLSTRSRLRLVVEIGTSSAGVVVVVLVGAGGLGRTEVSSWEALMAMSAHVNEAASALRAAPASTSEAPGVEDKALTNLSSTFCFGGKVASAPAHAHEEPTTFEEGCLVMHSLTQTLVMEHQSFTP